MPTEILMPALSPTMEEGTLARWLKKEGDIVKAGDIIAEIETDKATMEFEAVDEGKLGKILVEAGSEGVKVNTPIAILLAEGEDVPQAVGKLSGPVGQTQSQVMPSPEVSVPEQQRPAASPPQDRKAADQTRVFASPLARRIASDKGIELEGIIGSGPHGRIVRTDVEAAASSVREPTAVVPVTAVSPPATASTSADAVAKLYAGRTFEEIRLDGMRKTIAIRLAEAKQTIPHFYLRRDIRLDALMTFRTDLNARLEARKIKISVNDFIIKASALALQQVPMANAVWAGDRILKMKASDVAVAVAVEGGLYTPVIRDAEAKSLSAISSEMKELAGKARDRRLAPQDYLGGSFAISNLGMYGIDSFDAVINPPHAAILAVGAGVQKAIVINGLVEVGTIMTVTLSADHRVIDGALGAELLAAIKDYLENPVTMLV